MANLCPCSFGNSVSQALNNLRKAKKLREAAPEQESPATVLSRKVDTRYQLAKSDSSWCYLVTFRLENGEMLQLQTSGEMYAALKEGTAGILCWQGERLSAFTKSEGGGHDAL